MDYDEIMKTRFGATTLPKSTGDTGKDKERIVQWLLEIAFFRDFIYRNPEGKTKGKELSDVLIIYDDIVIIVQVKTHDSSKPAEEWIKKELPHGLKQLKGSYRMIKDRIVTNFENEILKTKIEIEPTKHRFIYGIVILACDSQKVDPLKYIDKDDVPDFTYHIFSLHDFETILQRMDTPGDFLSYYDLRFGARLEIKPKLQDEGNTMKKMLPLLPNLLGENFKKLTPEKQEKNLGLWERKLTSDANILPQYEYSVLIDDIIARVHDTDENLYAMDEKGKITNQRIAEFFGYVDRERRIALGKRMYECAKDATDGNSHWFPHCQRAAKRTFVYLYTSMSREDRRKFLLGLVIAAQRKYGFPRVLGIATNPLGQGGRAYDFVLLKENISENQLGGFSDIDKLFEGDDEPLL